MARIHDAAKRGDLEEVMSLVRRDPRVMESRDDSSGGVTPLYSAIWSDKLEVVYYLLDQGAGVKSHDEIGRTVLHAACIRGHLGTVMMLISRGADPTTKIYSGYTPLMHAILYNHMAVVHYLLRMRAVRAAINAERREGITAVWFAARDGHLEMVKWLVEAGADPVVADNEGVTPIDAAQLNHKEKCVEYLKVG